MTRMAQKLVNRSEFARIANVSGAAITKASRTLLKAACVGMRIDVNHPDAAAYLDRRAEADAPPTATGIDSKYEEAVQFCQATNQYTNVALQREFGIPYYRARKILKLMATAGLIPDQTAPPPPKQPPPARVVVGTERVRQRKKEHALKNLAAGKTIHEVPEDLVAFADMSLRELIQRFGTDVAFGDWLKATKSIEDINAARIKNAASEGKLVSRELVRVGVIDVFNSAFLRLMTDGAKTIAAEVAMKVQAGAEPPEIEAHVSEVLGSFIRPVKAKAARVLKNA